MPELTLTQLKRAVTELANRSSRRAEAINSLAKQIDEEATDTARIGDGIGAMGVDTETVSETQELSKIMAGLSEASLHRASAGDTTARRARAVYEQAHASHGGIQEAVSAAPIDTSGLNREFLRQE